MKLITFRSPGTGPAIGILDGEEIVPLASDPGLPAGMADFVALGAEGLQRAAAVQRSAERIPLEGSHLLAPIRPRNNVMCVGKNYHEHAREFAQSGFDSSAVNGAVPNTTYGLRSRALAYLQRSLMVPDPMATSASDEAVAARTRSTVASSA